MNSKEQVVWAREFNNQMERGMSDVEAYRRADAMVAALRHHLGSGVSDTDVKTAETPAEYADRVIAVLQQCVQASFADVQNGAGHVLVAMLGFAAQRAQDPPTPQAQHHHVRCELKSMPSEVCVHAGATFAWKSTNEDGSRHSGTGVVSSVLLGTGHRHEDKQFDAIVYGQCPFVGTEIVFDAPSIVMVGAQVVVSPVLARVNAIIA